MIVILSFLNSCITRYEIHVYAYMHRTTLYYFVIQATFGLFPKYFRTYKILAKTERKQSFVKYTIVAALSTHYSFNLLF